MSRNGLTFTALTMSKKIEKNYVNESHTKIMAFMFCNFLILKVLELAMKRLAILE